ncbi:SIR2 family protein [Plesiocystis pacifica]|uniref:SIR2 family protein n=1 Tax=Plesiocystis pacifica TaxID=191768 RepID=UPI0012FBAF20|nr:SIR2 family protein [Plesiocystis pacifica]
MRLPNHLENSIRCGSVVPVVGPGLTPTPDIPELLEQAATWLHANLEVNESRNINTLCQHREFGEALRIARRTIDRWTDFLDERYMGFEHWQEASASRALRPVWRLGSPLVVTTAYDMWIEHICPDSSPESYVVPRSSAPWLTRRQSVWHINGVATDPESMVFDCLADESLVHPTPSYERVLRAFWSLMDSRTLVFFGFSTDDFPSRQLTWLLDRFGAVRGPHYVLADFKLPQLAKTSVRFIPIDALGGGLAAVLDAFAHLHNTTSSGHG